MENASGPEPSSNRDGQSENPVNFNSRRAKAITLRNSDGAELYYNLSLELANPKDKVAFISNGEAQYLDKKDLLTRSLERKANNPYALSSLANLLGRGQAVELKLNEKLSLYTAIDLNKMAISIDPTHSAAYNNLGLCLPNKLDTLSLNGKTEPLTAQQLFVKAIECDVDNAEAYYNLSTTLENPTDTIDICLFNTPMAFTKIKLLLETIRCNPKYAKAFYNLGHWLSKTGKGTIEISLGGEVKQFSELELYIQSLEHDATDGKAFFNLGVLLKKGDSVSLKLDGQTTQIDKIKAFSKTIEHTPQMVDAYCHLAHAMFPSEARTPVQIGDRVYSLTALNLLHLAVELAPDHTLANRLLQGYRLILDQRD